MKLNTKEGCSLLLVVVLGILVLVAVGPLLFLWALHTIGWTSVGITFKTWLAALVLMAIMGGGKITTK